MPWTGPSFEKHNHALHGEAASKAASIANAVLRRSGDEGMSIAVANKYAATHPHKAFGGGMGMGHIGHITAAPKMGGSHAVMSPSMATPWWTRASEREMTAQPSGMGMPHMQAGGMMPMGEASPWWERAESRIVDQPFHGGLIGGSGAGRTDRIPLSLGSDSHVWPADTVSALGQGSTAGGGRILQAAMATGPYGVPFPKEVHGHGPPPAPHAGLSPHLASGGEDRKTSILAASGEYVSPPEEVLALGERGLAAGLGRKGESAMEVGHRLIDETIARIRKYHIGWLRKAPSPKR